MTKHLEHRRGEGEEFYGYKTFFFFRIESYVNHEFHANLVFMLRG